MIFIERVWAVCLTTYMLAPGNVSDAGRADEPPSIKSRTTIKLDIGEVSSSPRTHVTLQDPKLLPEPKPWDGWHLLCFSPDGRYLAASWTKTRGETIVTLWNLQTKKVERRFSHPCGVTTLKFLKSKEWLLTACTDGKVRVWEFKEGDLLHALPSPDRHVWGVRALDVAPDERSFVSGDCNLTLWDVATLKPTLLDLKIVNSTSEAPTGVSYSPDGKTLAYSCFFGVRTCDAKTGKRLKEMDTGDRAVNAIAYHPDGRSLVIGESGPARKRGWVRLWNVHDWKQITHANAFHGLTYQVGYTPDGKYLLAGGGYLPMELAATLRIWEVATGKEVTAFVPLPAAQIQFAVSRDGKWLATSGHPAREIHLYEMKTLLSPEPVRPGLVPPPPPP